MKPWQDLATSTPSVDEDTAATRLGRAIAPRAAAHPGETGIYAIPEPLEAFAARAILASRADRTLDVQYYIWRGDETGYLLFEALWEAAERGVRVRLLLDDNNTAGLDATIAALDAQPNIEVRLYNPLFHRRARALDYLTRFRRLNRRMHNKSFTADDQATIVGGRNVGNEYFGGGSAVWFKDLDVIAAGAVVREVSKGFELYWTSPSAHRAADLIKSDGPDGTSALLAKFEEVRRALACQKYLDSLRRTALVRDLLDGRLPLEWAKTRLFQDDPSKTLDPQPGTDGLLLTALMKAVGEPAISLDLVSPYLVPGREGTSALADLARRCAKVRILTNSLAATDVPAVHAGYARCRLDLLRAGVRLFELKPSAGDATSRAARGSGGSSSASLHAKTFTIDGGRVFVGSFNFDPRSALLNTEMGLLIESPALAQRLSKGFDDLVAESAYEVRLAPGGSRVEWIENAPSGIRRHVTEPGAGLMARSAVEILSLLPIEWLL